MSVSRRLRFEILKRDGFRCQYCGARGGDVILEVDHIKPVSGGGVDEPDNLISACFDCNRGKTDRGIPGSKSRICDAIMNSDIGDSETAIYVLEVLRLGGVCSKRLNERLLSLQFEIRGEYEVWKEEHAHILGEEG